MACIFDFTKTQSAGATRVNDAANEMICQSRVQSSFERQPPSDFEVAYLNTDSFVTDCGIFINFGNRHDASEVPDAVPRLSFLALASNTRTLPMPLDIDVCFQVKDACCRCQDMRSAVKDFVLMLLS